MTEEMGDFDINKQARAVGEAFEQAARLDQRELRGFLIFESQWLQHRPPITDGKTFAALHLRAMTDYLRVVEGEPTGRRRPKVLALDSNRD